MAVRAFAVEVGDSDPRPLRSGPPRVGRDPALTLLRRARAAAAGGRTRGGFPARGTGEYVCVVRSAKRLLDGQHIVSSEPQGPDDSPWDVLIQK
jgi:hypothetical protein